MYTIAAKPAPEQQPLVTLKRGDRIPSLQVTLEVAAQSLIGLPVRFEFWKKGSSGARMSGVATLRESSDSLIEYQWGTNDTQVAGDYYGEFKVTYPGTKTATFPSEGYLLFRVTD